MHMLFGSRIQFAAYSNVRSNEGIPYSPGHRTHSQNALTLRHQVGSINMNITNNKT